MWTFTRDINTRLGWPNPRDPKTLKRCFLWPGSTTPMDLPLCLARQMFYEHWSIEGGEDMLGRPMIHLVCDPPTTSTD
ncbi:hypothetical protein Pmani_003408 [Petrolisthes manimaculis]|uniref:Uncharacterized protein n=1 Tax=Petrolisthes manimaculis TaxID=1843537 RepID=A0AAE1UMI2_9EUCA|nr:hypothetical protein Pmani_003408 [Petrolisthes manimaculis]